MAENQRSLKSNLPVTVWSYKSFITNILNEFLNKYDTNLKDKVSEFVLYKTNIFEEQHSVCGKGSSNNVDYECCCVDC